MDDAFSGNESLDIIREFMPLYSEVVSWEALTWLSGNVLCLREPLPRGSQLP